METAGSADDLAAWAEVQVVGVAKQDLRARLSDLLGERPLTVAWVPTGMKTGVRISPWGVFSTPRRAAVVVSVLSRVNTGRN